MLATDKNLVNYCALATHSKPQYKFRYYITIKCSIIKSIFDVIGATYLIA